MDKKFTFWNDERCDICRARSTALVFGVPDVYDVDDPSGVLAAICGNCLRRAAKEIEEDGEAANPDNH